MPSEPSEITEVLAAWTRGEAWAGDRLMEIVYQDLRRMAARQLRGERAGHTLQTTALVHEAYLRIAGHERLDYKNRAQFFGLAARSMRRVLVDSARARKSRKRGAGAVHLVVEELAELGGERPPDLVALDEALGELFELDPQKARIVELRYFGGFEVREIAELLGVSVPTVNRHSRMAYAWLARALRDAR